VDLDGQVVGIDFDDLRLSDGLLDGNCSQLKGSSGVDGGLDGSVRLLGCGVRLDDGSGV